MTGALATSDQALDPPTSDFQEGFRSYLPLYNDYTGSSLSLDNDIQKPYDSLREIDFARLSDVAGKCAAIGDDFEEQLEDVNTQVGKVSGWSGNAADAFRGYVQQFQTASQTIDENLEAIADTTGDAASAGRQVISDYADAIGDIDFSGFDRPGDVQFMIDVERMLKPVGDVISAVMDWLGDLIGVVLPMPGGGGGLLGTATDFVMDTFGDAVDWILDALGFSIDGFLEWIAGKVREYLDSSFKDPFEANLQLLHDAVDAATTGIKDAFRPVIDAADAVTQSPFAALPVPPEGNPNQPPAVQPPPGGTLDGTPPGGTEPIGTPPGGTPPAGTPHGGTAGGTPPVGTTPGGTSGGTPGGTTPGGTEPASPPVDGAPPVTTPPAGGTPSVPPVDLPSQRPDEPLPVGGTAGLGDGNGGHPHGLPQGAGWIADPKLLPQGWTVDPVTGELLPPGAPGGEGDPEVHSPQAHHVLDGDGGVHTLPVIDQPGHGGASDSGDGGPTSVSVHEGDVTITVSADGGSDDGIQVTLTDGEGHRTEYTIEIGDDGRPELVPVDTAGATAEPATAGPPAAEPLTAGSQAHQRPVGQPAVLGASGGPDMAQSSNGTTLPAGVPTGVTPGVTAGEVAAATVAAAVGFAGTAAPAAASAGDVSGAVSGGDRGVVSGGVGGGHGVASGEVSGGPSFASSGYSGSLLDGGQVASGNIGAGHGAGSGGEGGAQLASASDSGGRTPGGGTPGGAQLASVGDDPRSGQSGGVGAPMMPMSGAVGGGDEERRGGTWQVPVEDLFDADELYGRIRGVLGEDR